MPKTFWESALFTTIMACCMVFIMSGYNNILHSSEFSWGLLIPNVSRFFNEFFVAYPLALLFTGRLVPFIVNKIVPENKSWLKIFLIPCGIAMIMAPLMTLYVQIRNFGLTSLNSQVIFHNIEMNFIFAYLIQVMFLGPLVRFLFQKIIVYKPYVSQWIVQAFSGAFTQLLVKLVFVLNGTWLVANTLFN